MDLEQHFTTGSVLAELGALFAKLELRGRHVLEIGAGKGAVTELILARDAARVTAFEIDPGLCALKHERLTLREEDAMTADLGFSWDCLIAVPPYELLGFLSKIIGNRDYLLMIPDKPSAFARFPGATPELTFDGAAFEPPARGKHIVIQRGFR